VDSAMGPSTSRAEQPAFRTSVPSCPTANVDRPGAAPELRSTAVASAMGAAGSSSAARAHPVSLAASLRKMCAAGRVPFARNATAA
jgi:hypothetical protein